MAVAVRSVKGGQRSANPKDGHLFLNWPPLDYARLSNVILSKDGQWVSTPSIKGGQLQKEMAPFEEGAWPSLAAFEVVLDRTRLDGDSKVQMPWDANRRAVEPVSPQYFSGKHFFWGGRVLLPPGYRKSPSLLGRDRRGPPRKTPQNSEIFFGNPPGA
jgi:hypothetical protein